MADQRDESGANFAPGFPVGGGELGQHIRGFDWSATSLGPIAGWPQSLKTATDIVLQSPLPMVMLWGSDGVMIYNDAYSAFAGQRHPRLLGSKVLEGWPEVADFNARVMAEGLVGRTLSFRDQQLVLARNGVPEEVWMDLNYSPVLAEDGRPAGVLAIVVETTGKMQVERQLATERAAVIEANERLTAESSFLRELFEQAPSFMAIATGPEHTFTLANHAYLQLIGRDDVLGLTVKQALPEIENQGFPELLDRVQTTGEPFIGRGASVLLRTPAGEMQERFLDFIYQPITNAEGRVTGIFMEGQDVTERTRAEQHLRLVVNELNHRVKNTLSMIQAIAAQTFRNAEDLPHAQEVFSSRILALAKANDLLTGQNWEGADLTGIFSLAARTHAGEEPGRFVIDGPHVRLSPKAALSLSMATHELATNAVKYGALSTDKGRLRVSWSVDGVSGRQRLRLLWQESGGPRVSAPTRRGFGSRLIERGLAAELAGKVDVFYKPEGVECLIDAPLDIYDGQA